jgi:pilus assembly protein Flp/PilA
MRQFYNRVRARSFMILAESRDESGQALIEYALIISLIAVVAIGALELTGNSVLTMLNTVAGDV